MPHLLRTIIIASMQKSRCSFLALATLNSDFVAFYTCWVGKVFLNNGVDQLRHFEREWSSFTAKEGMGRERESECVCERESPIVIICVLFKYTAPDQSEVESVIV